MGKVRGLALSHPSGVFLKRLLVAIVLAVLATGCTGNEAGGPATASPAKTPVATPTVTPSPMVLKPGQYTFKNTNDAVGTMSLPGTPDPEVEKLRATGRRRAPHLHQRHGGQPEGERGRRYARRQYLHRGRSGAEVRKRQLLCRSDAPTGRPGRGLQRLHQARQQAKGPGEARYRQGLRPRWTARARGVFRREGSLERHGRPVGRMPAGCLCESFHAGPGTACPALPP